MRLFFVVNRMKKNIMSTRIKKQFKYLLALCALLICTHLQAKVDVAFDGVEGRLLDNIKSYVQIANLNQDKDYRAFQIRFLFKRAEDEIRTALEPFGYYNVEIKSQLDSTESGWQARYSIALNDPVRIARVNWKLKGDAEDDKVFRSVLSQSPLKHGAVFEHAPYEQIKTQLLSLAAQRGYRDAEWEKANVRVDIETNTAVIDAIFSSGERYHFGDIEFNSEYISEDLLQRYPRFEKSEAFNTSSLSDLQVNLSESGYFETVQVNALWDQAAKSQVPIQVDTTPNQRSHYRFGLGYGTDTGARISAGFDRRWINPRGHLFKSQLQLSQFESRLTALYQIPGPRPQTDSYQFRSQLADKTTDSQESQLIKIGAAEIRAFNHWQYDIGAFWLNEDFEIGEQRGNAQLLVPTVEWRFLSADERININRGWRANFSIQTASRDLLSEADLIRGRFELKSVVPLLDSWRLLARAEVGAMYTDSFEAIPPSLRFFAGGDQSVRGYAYEQLGPEDGSGDVIGGRYLAVASAEIDYRFAENWRIAAFTDIGNAMLEPNQPLKQSVGIGFRWISPIGSVRIDFAQAIDEPNKPWRIHLTIGPDL
ncbi:MAG: hypothetical protein AWU56_1031 [Idiomarina sp. T82-3]|nr:MAG: hypothetical protein AWU56_1031 [Idiomarina sp. T82-3]